ncbi:MAG: 30S ribosome-binding factor RbfA [Anaerolineae bacterium]|nr:30S ribosome-binding factor RbfA [Chloroflexota bacterium]MBP6298346.1 30S ribosome-binding factor RbfA [Anaerolineae bacterium]
MSIKQDRMAGRIHEILSVLMLRDVADPRLHDVTVTDVKLDPELMFAKVYVNAFGDETRKKEVLQGLRRANSFLRREVAQRIHLRNAPELQFVWDEGLERSERVQRLFQGLVIPPPDPEDELKDEVDLDDDSDAMD